MTTTTDAARALAELILRWCPPGDQSRAHAALRALAGAQERAEKAEAAGRDLVALVEHLAAEHVDPTTMTPLARQMIRARMNRARATLGLPQADYTQPDQVDARATLGEGGGDA